MPLVPPPSAQPATLATTDHSQGAGQFPTQSQPVKSLHWIEENLAAAK